MSLQTDTKGLYRCDYVSYSSWYTFKKCKLQYKYNYIDKRPKVVTKHMSTIFGTVMHEALANFYKSSNFTFEELKWLFFNALMMNINKEKIDYVKEPLDVHLNRGYAMIERIYDKQKVDGELKKAEFVELPFAIYSEKLGCKIGGRIDLGMNNVILDWKTEKKPNFEEAKKSLQLTIYSWAYRKLFNKDESGVCLYFLEPNDKIVYTRDKESYKELFCEVKAMKEFIENAKAEDFVKNDKDCFFCDYKDVCRSQTAKVETKFIDSLKNR